MNNKIYDPKLAQYAFDVNAHLGISEEQTALAIAKDCGKEQEFQEAMNNRPRGGWIFRKHAEDVPSILERICKPSPEESSKITNGKYILMPRTATYAQGLHALRNACQADANSVHPVFTLDDGSKIYRPLTFKEDITARVTDYNTLHNPDGSERTPQERLKLFTERWLDSCAGIAYKKRSTKFKIMPISPQLITIPENFNQSYIKVDYDQMGGVELDRKDAIYNAQLTKKQIETHPAWRAAVEDDLALLKEYRNIVFAEKKTKTAMGFWLQSEIAEDQLRALFVNGLDDYSDAYGDGNLDSGGSFLRVAPVVARKNNG